MRLCIFSHRRCAAADSSSPEDANSRPRVTGDVGSTRSPRRAVDRTWCGTRPCFRERCRDGHRFCKAQDELNLKCHIALTWNGLESDKDMCTEHMIRHLPGHTWLCVAAHNRVSQMRALVSPGYWRELPKRNRLAGSEIAVISTSVGVQFGLTPRAFGFPHAWISGRAFHRPII